MLASARATRLGGEDRSNAEGILVGGGVVLALALALLIYATRRATCNPARPSGHTPIDPGEGQWKFGWSEHAFQSLVENYADPILRYDRDCRRLYANPAAARLTNVASEMLIGSAPDDEALLDSAPGRRLMEAIRDVFASGEKRELLLEYVAPDGQRRDHHLLVTPERSGDGKAETVLVTSRDVTEMRRIEASHSQYLDVAPGLFYTLIQDPNGAYVMSFANAGVYDLYGLEADAVMKDFSSLLALVHPDDVEMRRCAQEKSARDLTPFHVEYRIVHPWKGLRWLEVHSLPQRLRNGGTRWDGFVHDITERRTLEELNRKHQQELRALAENSPDIIMRYDRDCRRIYVNPAFVKEVGKTVEELLGGTPTEYSRLPQAVLYQEALQQAIASGREIEHEYTWPTASGRIVVTDFRIVPERDASGQIASVLAIGRDITERKHMEEALAAREQAFHSLAENSLDVIVRYDLELRRTYINPAWALANGMTVEEALGKRPTETASVVSDSAREIEDALRKVLERGASGEIEFGGKDRLGNMKYFAMRVVLEYGMNGEVASLLTMANDITERRRMEDELRRREDEFRTLAESLPVAVIRYDAGQRRRYLNPAATRMLHGTADELLGHVPGGPTVPATPAMLGHYRGKMDEVLATNSARELEFVLDAQPDDDQKHYEVRFVPEHGADGKPAGVLAIWYDITERKRMEGALQDNLRFTRELIEAIPGPIFYKDADGLYLGCNAAFEQFYAIRRDELVGKGVFDLWPPDLAERYHAADRQLIENYGTLIYEAQVQTPEGRRNVVFHKATFARADGSIGGQIGVILDITERKRIEQAMAVREREFRTLVENTPDTIARYDRECRRRFANKTFCSLVDGGAAALLGKTPTEYPGGKNAYIYEARINEVFATGENAEFELQWKDRDGKDACSHVRLTPECDSSGEIVSVLAVGHDITELSLSRQKIHRMAFYDALTALPNRALFNDRLPQMLIEASRRGRHAGVMLLDLDRFKVVNDTLGHSAGDQLLREAGARLSSCLRTYDTVARLGGDEFALLLPEIRSGDDLGKIASNILTAFNEPFMLEDKEAFVSTSIGIAAFPGDSLDADELLKQADSAMYSAKRSGGKAFCFYSKDLTDSANERLTLEADLRHGFERGQLELYYQPKVCLAEGLLLGSEALLRWRHPTHGMVAPDKFIPIAEDSGQIIEIGAWVLREACRTASAWNQPGMPPHKVAINLSARQFQVGNLLQTVRDALDETNCRTEWIELEITESLLLDDNGKTPDVLDAFRAMGITIAIDDFGTGYSSLSYLARFPIDTLKIDRSFINRMTQGRHHAELVKAIISIAHSLQQQVVAEGVETEEEAAFLRDHGCHVAQGYLFGKPVPKSAFLTKHGFDALPASTTEFS